MKSFPQLSRQAKCCICHQNLESFAPSSNSSSGSTLCRNCQIIQERSAGSVSFAQNTSEEFQDEKLAGVIRERFAEIQDRLSEKLKRLDFEIEVFCQEEKSRIEKKDVSDILDNLNQLEMTREFLEAYEKTEELDSETFEKNEGDDVFQRNIKENLITFHDDFEKDLELLDLKPLSSLLIEHVLRLYGSNAEEVMFMMIMKKMDILRLKGDDGRVLNLSLRRQNEFKREMISYDEIKNVEGIDLKMEKKESLEMMVLSLNFLLENCLKKVSSLKLSFTGRYISNQEAEGFSHCAIFQRGIKFLIVDFTSSTFESEETLLNFFTGGAIKSDGLKKLKYFLADTNATQKTVERLSELIISRAPTIQSFGADLSNLLITDPVSSSVQFSGLTTIDLNVRRTCLNDYEMIHFSEKTLSGLKDLQELRLWLDNTQVTDKGLLQLYKSIQVYCASQLKAFGLGVGENSVTDESLGEFAGSVLPLMKNLEEFRLLIQKTLITDDILFTLCKNIKHFAPTLKVFALDVTETAATDQMMNGLALVSVPLMKRLEAFTLRFRNTKITDQSLYNLYSSMGATGIFSALKEFELDYNEVKVTDQTFAIFANKVLPKMTKLEKLTFYANKTKLGDSSLKPFSKNLSLSLQTLNISLDETNIGKQAILALAETLNSLSQLTHLSLNFNQTKLDDSSVSCLCASLKRFARNLQSLRLGLDDTKITDKGIMMLGNEIAPEIISLKELKLSLSRTRASDLSLKPLFENLKGTMENLEDLQLCLNRSFLTDQSLITLANSSVPSPSLKSFELLVGDTDVSDLSLVPLMRSLKNKLCDVSKSALSFRKTKITDETIWTFSTYALINMKNLQDFQFSFGENQVSHPNLFWFFCNLIIKVQRIRRFELDFCDKFGDLQVQLFGHLVLPNFSQTLQYFKLNWRTPNLLSSTFRVLCFQALKAFKKIKTFHLSSSALSVTCAQEAFVELHFELNESQITDFVMHEILKKFQDRVSQVKNFSFLVQGTQVASRSIQTLASHIFPFMQSLESLTINFDNIALTDQDFCLICKSLKVFAKNLKFLKINLGIRSISHSSILSLTKDGLSHMRNLEKLYLDFNSNKNIEKSLGVFFTGLQGCAEKLRLFSLSLTGLELPLEANEILATWIFPKLKNLESFHLGLYETGMTDSEFVLLFSGLKEEGVLKNIVSFTLGIHEGNLTDEALDMLSREILSQLKNVETFGCYFANNGNITDGGGLMRLSKKLNELGGQIVNLIFRFENMEISNERVTEFALKTLCEMKHLKDLDVSFGFSKVSDKGIVDLFCGIGKILEGLNSLQLGLQNTRFTDVAFEVFKKQVVPKLGSLKRLSLDFSENTVSEENQSFIESILQKYQEAF